MFLKSRISLFNILFYVGQRASSVVTRVAVRGRGKGRGRGRKKNK